MLPSQELKRYFHSEDVFNSSKTLSDIIKNKD
jgi:hypothetical protein